MTTFQSCKARHFSQNRWFRIHNAVLDCFARILGADGVLVYSVLCRHARDEKILGMTVKAIADEAGIGRTKAFNVLALLEKNLLVRRQKMPGQTSAYLLLDVYHAVSACKASSPRRHKEDTQVPNFSSREQDRANASQVSSDSILKDEMSQ
jgi:hypothetical protein